MCAECLIPTCAATETQHVGSFKLHDHISRPCSALSYPMAQISLQFIEPPTTLKGAMQLCSYAVLVLQILYWIPMNFEIACGEYQLVHNQEWYFMHA